MKKIEINVSVVTTIALCVIGYSAIIAMIGGAFFLIRDIIFPHFSTHTVIKLSFLGISVLFVVALFLALSVMKSRLGTFIFLTFSTLIGLGLFIFSFLAPFGVYKGIAEIIFGWQSLITGLGLLAVSFIFFFTSAQLLLNGHDVKKQPKIIKIGTNKFSKKMKKLLSIAYDVLMAFLATLVILALGSIFSGIFPARIMMINYYTGLAIYLVVGLIILQKAKPKIISFLAGLTITIAGFSLFLFFMTMIVFKNEAAVGNTSIGNTADTHLFQILTTLHQPFLYTSIVLTIFMVITLYNVMGNKNIAEKPWLERREPNHFWLLALLITVIELFSFLDWAEETVKRYRSFLKVLTVGLLCLIIGRAIILQFGFTSKESQAVVWWFCGLATYLYLGRKLIKSGRRVAIFSLLAASVTVSFFLVVFLILGFFPIYTPTSQAVLSWPVFYSLLLLGFLTVFAHSFYYRSIPGKSYGEKIREWLKDGKDALLEKSLLLIILGLGVLTLLIGMALMIFQTFLTKDLALLISQVKKVGEISLLIGGAVIFIATLVLIASVIRENMLSEMTPEERAKYEKDEIETMARINSQNVFGDQFHIT